MKLIKLISTVCPLLTIVACGNLTEQSQDKPTANIQRCEDPRPQLCTMDYRPVCATFKNNQQKTFPNGCGACANPDVVSYQGNACVKPNDARKTF